MDKSKAFQRQMINDVSTAERLRSDAQFCCQVVAKYQQAVEKALKAIVYGLVEKGIVSPGPRETHEIDVLFNTLDRLPKKRTKTFFDEILSLLDENLKNEAKELCSLAPKAGNPDLRNTEYPYQDKGKWRAPADPNAFTLNHDVKRFKAVADRICPEVAGIIAAIEYSSK